MSDSIERRAIVLGADVRATEFTDAIYQLINFLPPSSTPLHVTDILEKIRNYIKKVVLSGIDISINVLLFHIQVKCTPGHTIEIFIRLVTPVSDKSYSTSGVNDYTTIYTGDWR